MKYNQYKERTRIDYKENTRFLIIYNYVKRKYPDITYEYNAVKYDDKYIGMQKSTVLLGICEKLHPNSSQEILKYVRKRRNDEKKREKRISDDFKKRNRENIDKLHQKIRENLGL